MRAFVLRDGELAVRETPTPRPGSGQVLVRTLACAICASDHHYLDQPEVARTDRSGMRVEAVGCDVVMGHEYCGEVVEYGPHTKQEWPIGTRVTSVPVLFTPSGQMRIIGMAPDAPGGFGEYFLLNEFAAKPVPDDVPPELVAVNDAMAVGWYYSRIGTTGGPAAGTVPLVIGLGAIGASVVAGLKRRGAGPIIASDYSESRRASALALGADIVVDPAVESPYEMWRETAWGSREEMHDYMLAASLKGQVVYDCAGTDGVMADIVTHCEFGARILSAGGSEEDVIPTTPAHLKGLNIQYGGGPAIADWYDCLDLVVRGELDASLVIGETVGLDELPEAFERARLSTSPIRIVYKA